MRTDTHTCRVMLLLLVLLGMTGGVLLSAQDAKLKVRINPKQAYVFVDGQPYGEANRTLTLTAGSHEIGFYNYGYKPDIRKLALAPGQTTDLDITLEAVKDNVSGPFGCITLEGANRDAVFLNGTTPDYFVGHGDEFNHEWWWKQELVVPPGAHQLTIMRQGTKLWAGTVNVAANQRVVVDVPNGVRKTVSWPRGEKFSAVPRFGAGTASARVAVAKPTAQFTAQTPQSICGSSTNLQWSSTDAANVEILGLGPVAASGERTVQPNENSTYELKAMGPGGTATSSTTVSVNNAIQTQLALLPAEIHYRRIGDKVEQSTSELKWNVSNAKQVSISPLGSVDASGTQALQVVPKKTDPGQIDETIAYTLTATNPCGGRDTRTVNLHIVGNIEGIPDMRSIYFPTDLPKPHRMRAGLLPSEQEGLTLAVTAFKQQLASTPDARLRLIAHADQRGPKRYNQALSERRARLVKNYLIKQGIPEASIEIQPVGESRNLKRADVDLLIEKSDLSPELRQKVLRQLSTLVLAHNRRVDAALIPTGQESLQRYPFNSEDYKKLVQRGKTVAPRAQQGATVSRGTTEKN